MIGVVRPEARYAVPMSWMKTVGEWVSRPEPGRSIPRGEIAPPYTVTAGFAAFRASYVFASSEVEAGAARSSPFGPNCGSQKRLRFGSLPMMKFFRPGMFRARYAA